MKGAKRIASATPGKHSRDIEFKTKSELAAIATAARLALEEAAVNMTGGRTSNRGGAATTSATAAAAGTTSTSTSSEAGVATILARLDTLQARVDERFDGVEGRLVRMETRYDELSTNVGVLQSTSEDLQQRVTALEADRLTRFLHTRKLLLRVPQQHVLQVGHIVTSVLKEVRPHDVLSVQVVTRPPRPRTPDPSAAAAASGTQPGGRQPTALVDLLVHEEARRAVAVALGKPLRDRYGIAVMDSLTKAGVDVKRQRQATFTRLKAEGKQPRWERGVELKVLGDNGRYVPYTGPYDGANNRAQN